MNNGYKYLAEEQRLAAVQRLTALWAFTESGLGGIMHALKIPFTGLIVGGMAVIIISLIAEISNPNLKQILKSALIVLIVKAMVSPYTPFPAYIAVSFQALLAFALFRLLRVHFFSILLLSSLAMIESVFQKLLILTLIYGKGLWKAMDELVAYVIKQFGMTSGNGSRWIVGTYLCVYIIGGIIIAWIAYKMIKSFYAEKDMYKLTSAEIINEEIYNGSTVKRKSLFPKLWMMILLLAVISVVLFIFSADAEKGWLAVAKTVSWTLLAIFVWYMLIGPLLTKLIQKLLQKQESRYSDEVLNALSFLPVMRRLASLAWQKSKSYSGLARWQFFFSAMIHWSLTCSEPSKKE